MRFYHRPSQKAARIIWTPDQAKRKMSNREEIIKYYLQIPEEEALKIRSIPFNPPEKAIVARFLPCAKCGENTAEYAIRFREGQPYCLDCWPEPSQVL